MQRHSGSGRRQNARVSILTGPEGPVQLECAAPTCAELLVSILTGPEGPVQPGLAGNFSYQALSFQSSPAPKDRCNQSTVIRNARYWWFQSSPAPKDRCNMLRGRGSQGCLRVSILTGPEGPVQLPFVYQLYAVSTVSILTGPEGPVQPRPLFSNRAGLCFNPHRPRRTGATSCGCRCFVVTIGFQSSPAPKDRCNARSCGRLSRSVCFNPHRPRRTGATEVE